MANLQIHLDDVLMDRAQDVAREMGLDLASAVRMFLCQMVYENALPFRPSADPFYSKTNMIRLKQSLGQLKAAKSSLHEVAANGKALDGLQSAASFSHQQ